MLPPQARARARGRFAGAWCGGRTLAAAAMLIASHALVFIAARRAGAPAARAGDPLVDACEWDAAVRPLDGQEWIDATILPLMHPLLPAGAAGARVYATKRQGASYGPHREFWETVADGTWEPDTFRLIRAVHTRRPGGAHLDVGAWVGPTSLFAAHFAARVVALEPDPRAFSELLGNFRLNAALAARATLLRHCLAPRGGRVDMTGPAPLGSSMSRVHGAARVPAAAGKEENWGPRMASWPAECSTPAALAARAGLRAAEIALIKVDVEGAEAALLPAIAAWLAAALPAGAPRPTLLVELHRTFWPDAGADARRVADALATWPFLYRSVEGAQRHKAGTSDFQTFDPVAAVARSGFVCEEDYCMVLATGEAFDWATDRALLDGAEWAAPRAGEK